MILTRLDSLAAFRMHLPKWAVAPTCSFIFHDQYGAFAALKWWDE